MKSMKNNIISQNILLLLTCVLLFMTGQYRNPESITLPNKTCVDLKKKRLLFMFLRLLIF